MPGVRDIGLEVRLMSRASVGGLSPSRGPWAAATADRIVSQRTCRLQA